MYQQQPSSALQAAVWARKAWQGLQMLGLWLMLLCAAQPALAQTPVTGVITSYTTLRAAQSPYLFQGDVIVDNNATLSIEPGVTIQMAAAASFTLKRGALQAVGTPSLPIKITSASATPAAGDWRQWRFTAGTNQALTQLGHVVIEYGSGVAIESASPVINNTAINHHSGPAISMDLASSPVGTGNTANGNSLNAVSVPSGAIQSQVTWGLVGIPYLVEQGLVHVGKAPMPVQLVSASGKSVAVGKRMLTPSGDYYPTAEVYLRRSEYEPGSDNQTINVHLRCLNAGKCRPVPQTLTISPNQEIANFQIEGLEIGSTQLEAMVDGYEQSTLIAVDVVAPVVHIKGLEGSRSIGGLKDEFSIELEVPGTFYFSGVYLSEATFVNLSVVEQSPGVVVNGIYGYWGEPIGELTAYSYAGASSTIVNYVYVGEPVKGGSYRVKAEVDGIGSSISDIQWIRYEDGMQIQSISNGSINYALIGKGFYPSDLALVFVESGEPVAFDHEIVVKLKCSDETVCVAPETVIIPANQTYTSIDVKGLGVGVSQIEMISEGFPVTTTPVKVVLPKVYFEQLDGVRFVNDGNDYFNLMVLAEDRGLVSNNQMPFEDSVVSFSLVDKNPDDIVRGIFGYQNEDPIFEDILRKDAYGTQVFIDNPIATGSYRVSASLEGGAITISEQQLVISPSSSKSTYEAEVVGQRRTLGKEKRTVRSSPNSGRVVESLESTRSKSNLTSAGLKPGNSAAITVNP